MSPTSRRRFLASSALLGAASLIPSRALSAPGEDYRALVCVFLDGGVDHLHTLLPFDATNDAALSRFRSVPRPPRSTLTRLVPRSPTGGLEVALHPALPRLKGLFDAGRLAIVTGVGELEEPTTRAALTSGAVRRPPSLGSHNDGASFVHTFGPEGTRFGWGGLSVDELASGNPDQLFASVGVGLSNPFGSGRLTQVVMADALGRASNIAGVDGALFGSQVAAAELRAILARSGRTNVLERDYASINQRVFASSARLAQAFSMTASLAPLPSDEALPNYAVAWRDNPLARALRTVVRCIASRSLFNVKRQVFFVRLGGWDTHANMVDDLERRRFIELDAGLSYFQQSLDALGLSENVTTFTTSEFGRSLRTNGDGTDHGWGGLAFVLGGAVRGGDLYGTLTEVSDSGPGYVSILGGPMAIPTISNHQYCATLAKWFGVPDSRLPTLFPGLERFSPTLLPFMA